MLEVDGDRLKALMLEETIGRKPEHEIRFTNNVATLHVLDLDATTTATAVENAVRNLAELGKPQSVTLRSMRPTRDGNQ